MNCAAHYSEVAAGGAVVGDGRARARYVKSETRSPTPAGEASAGATVTTDCAQEQDYSAFGATVHCSYPPS